MNILTLLSGFVIPFIAIIFESYPRFINRTFGVDIWTHLLYLNEFKRQKGIPSIIKGGFIVPGEYDYPPAFITILSRFPVSLVERFEFLFSPVFDSIHILLLYIIVYIFSNNVVLAILAQCIYVLTPIIIIENSSATPRSLGYLLFSIVQLNLYMFFSTGQLMYAATSFLAGTCIFLSHRFTTQGFLFFSIIFSVLYHTPVPIIIFIFSFIGAVLLSKGFYLKVLVGHLGNLKFWRDVIEYRYAHQVKGNNGASNSKDAILRLYNQFLKFPPFVLAITNPWVLTSFLILFISKPTSFEGYFLVWVGISYALSVLTLAIKPLRFLGEGQRYLELSAFPAAFLSAEFIMRTIKIHWGVYAVLLYSIFAVGAFATIIVIQRKAIILDRMRTLTPELREMFSYLSGVRTKPKLLCIPHQITTNTIYHTGCQVFVNADYTNIEKISDVYPFIRLPIRTIMKKYNLTRILLNVDFSPIKDLHIGKYHIEKQSGEYVLLKLK